MWCISWGQQTDNPCILIQSTTVSSDWGIDSTNIQNYYWKLWIDSCHDIDFLVLWFYFSFFSSCLTIILTWFIFSMAISSFILILIMEIPYFSFSYSTYLRITVWVGSCWSSEFKIYHSKPLVFFFNFR